MTGREALPLNTFGLENANPLHLDEEDTFAAGDVRANEQIGLIAMHTLFLEAERKQSLQQFGTTSADCDEIEVGKNDLLLNLAAERCIVCCDDSNECEREFWAPRSNEDLRARLGRS